MIFNKTGRSIISLFRELIVLPVLFLVFFLFVLVIQLNNALSRNMLFKLYY